MINSGKYILTGLFLIFSGFTTLIAQPSVPGLADQMEQANEDRLSNINNLELTVRMKIGEVMQEETVTRYVKETRGGRSMLVPDTDHDMYDDQELLEGVYDGSVEKIVRGAESIENDQLDGRPAYKLFISDEQLLTMFEDDMPDPDEMRPEIDNATIWIDRQMLVPLRMVYGQEEGEDGISIEIRMQEYEMHSGLPIAKKISVDIQGISSMFSEEEMAEARRAMEQMKEQLAQMPEAQRQMIKSRMAGQMEQFEEILESGNAGSTTMEVIAVRVNQ